MHYFILFLSCSVSFHFNSFCVVSFRFALFYFILCRSVSFHIASPPRHFVSFQLVLFPTRFCFPHVFVFQTFCFPSVSIPWHFISQARFSSVLFRSVPFRFVWYYYDILLKMRRKTPAVAAKAINTNPAVRQPSWRGLKQ